MNTPSSSPSSTPEENDPRTPGLVGQRLQPRTFLSEEGAPPVDRQRLKALAERTLTEPETRDVCELLVRYRSWSDAFAAELLAGLKSEETSD